MRLRDFRTVKVASTAHAPMRDRRCNSVLPSVHCGQSGVENSGGCRVLI
jgi:hypothetical protein